MNPSLGHHRLSLHGQHDPVPGEGDCHGGLWQWSWDCYQKISLQQHLVRMNVATRSSPHIESALLICWICVDVLNLWYVEGLSRIVDLSVSVSQNVLWQTYATLLQQVVFSDLILRFWLLNKISRMLEWMDVTRNMMRENRLSIPVWWRVVEQVITTRIQLQLCSDGASVQWLELVCDHWSLGLESLKPNV